MSTNKHIEEYINTWATWLAGVDDNQDGFVTDHNYSMALRDGSNYYEWQPNRYWNGAAWTYYDVTYDDITANGDVTVGDDLSVADDGYIGGLLGIGTASPSTYLDIEATGASKAVTDFVEITNNYNAADMVGTGTGILINQWYYDGTTPAVAEAARIAYITDDDWTSTASTRDGHLSIDLSYDGVMLEMFRITTDETSKSFRLFTEATIWDSDNERAAMDMVDREYAHFGNYSATTGGLRIVGARDTSTGICLEARTTAESATYPGILLDCKLDDGAGGVTEYSDTSRLVDFRTNDSPIIAFYANGKIQQLYGTLDHGMTDYLPTTAYYQSGPTDPVNPSRGGVRIIGAGENGSTPMELYGIGEASCSIHSYIDIVAGAASGTGITDINSLSYALRVVNNATQLLGVYGDGDIDCIGNNITFGDGSAGDPKLAFNSGNDAYIQWMEDEQRLDILNSSIRALDKNFGVVANGAAVSLYTNVYSDTLDHYGVLNFYHAGGTEASPTATLSGMILGAIQAYGRDTADSVGAQMRFEATADWASGGDTTDNPTKIVLSTCPDGSGTLVDRLTIGSDGGIYLHSIKSGATQVAAGAAAGEVWKTASHATLPDNVLLIGV